MANEPTDIMAKPTYHKLYLGDAVYAEFDGYQVWLTTGDGNSQRIALESGVFANLLQYTRNFWRFNAG